MKIHFLGAAKQISGACFLVEAGEKRMLVDCGLFQGEENLRRKNYEPFPFDPKDIDYVLLTHAHTDHIGRVPQLVKKGFQGKIFATEPTRDFFPLMLGDSLKHLKEEAELFGAETLYAAEDLLKAETLITPLSYGERLALDSFLSIRFFNAGHILGSSIIEIVAEEKGEKKTVVFSGDLGNDPSPLLPSPDRLEKADIIVVESTYGGRFHEDASLRADTLEDVVEEVAKNNGVLLVPTFSLERIHMLLYELNSLCGARKIPAMPIFIDSPLAVRLLAVYEKFGHFLRQEALPSLGVSEVREIFRFPNVRFTRSVEDSKKIFEVHSPKIVIASSGMSSGGRVVFHEKEYLPLSSTTILFVNFQGKGTRGAKILRGDRTVEIGGEKVAVRANIRTIFGYSAHADQGQLERWLKHFEKPVQKIFMAHGEEKQATALAVWARDNLGVDTHVPELGEVAEI